MNHRLKRRRQALHQTHHHYYLNISLEAANLSDWRIESKKSNNQFGSENLIESNRNFFCPNWNALVRDADCLWYRYLVCMKKVRCAPRGFAVESC